MRRPAWIWCAFGLCVALATLTMSRVSALVLELERAEARIRHQAARDENVQLALWRMDSALAPLLAEESARPYFTYNAFYPAERAYTQMHQVVNQGDVLVASPLLTFASPRILLHFQFGPDGLTSPQVPEGAQRELAETRLLPPEQRRIAEQRLADLRWKVTEPMMSVACASVPTANQEPNPFLGMFLEPSSAQTARTQSRGSVEYMMRFRNKVRAQEAAPERSPPVAAAKAVAQAPMEAAWIDGALILGRRVQVGPTTLLQGCWLNWEAIRRELLGSVSDLVPVANLEPVLTDHQAPPTRRLATLPVRLVMGPAETEVPSLSGSPIRLSLAVAWASLIVSAGAVALLLGGTLSLSERRGTFVSAVTHELRTPLTTFRLYTEMLAEGMVPDPKTRDSYLQTLRAESDRLGHLVENVLAFACIERGRTIERRDVLSVSELADRLRPTLAARAERAGMQFVVDAKIPQTWIRTDISMVEQVLANLVDNASKYAANSSDPRIELESRVTNSWVVLSIRDHGPGLPDRAMRRLFRPFSKSAHDAAHSAPGVGLGLALSRRLARALGGDLRLERNGPEGVTFSLTLPGSS